MDQGIACLSSPPPYTPDGAVAPGPTKPKERGVSVLGYWYNIVKGVTEGAQVLGIYQSGSRQERLTVVGILASA